MRGGAEPPEMLAANMPDPGERGRRSCCGEGISPSVNYVLLSPLRWLRRMQSIRSSKQFARAAQGEISHPDPRARMADAGLRCALTPSHPRA